MGQGSSQPLDMESQQYEDTQNDAETHNARPSSRSPSALRKTKRKSQQDEEALTKRKRNSVQNDSSFSVADITENNSPPIKRKKLIDSLESNGTPRSDRKAPSQFTDSPRITPRRPVDEKARNSASRPASAHLLKRSNSMAADRTTSMSPSLSIGGSQVKGRLNRSNGSRNDRGATGAFQPDEVETLEGYKIQFCNAHGCPTGVFDLMVQHGKEGPFPGELWVNKRTFWATIHTLLPNRDRRSVYRFMKRHFQASGQKPHEWTDEQEDELVDLHKQHGPKWAVIAELLGRSNDDVVQRWKNHLEHRATMNTGPWSEGESGLLLKAMLSAWARMNEEGYDVGRDVYEMDESLISWGRISEAMLFRRSRQQCADKWRRHKGKLAHGSMSQSGSRSVTPLPTLGDSFAKEHVNLYNFTSNMYVNSDGEERPGRLPATPAQTILIQTIVTPIQDPRQSRSRKIGKKKPHLPPTLSRVRHLVHRLVLVRIRIRIRIRIPRKRT
ncbi:hypothetical protein BJX99DRAFT_121715 [Aspergillus californicus]